jgi:hypothetical protein
MEWLEVYWDAEIEAYLGQHGVGREDFEQVMRNPIGEDSSDSSGKPIRFGFALDGRKIAAVFEWIDDMTVLPITAYEVP